MYNYCRILCRFEDVARYWPKIANFSHHISTSGCYPPKRSRMMRVTDDRRIPVGLIPWYFKYWLMCLQCTFLTEYEVNKITFSTAHAVHGLPLPWSLTTEPVSDFSSLRVPTSSSSSSSAPISEHSRLRKLTPLWTILRTHPRCVETKIMGLKVELVCTEPYPPWSTCPASPIRWRTIDGCSKDARVSCDGSALARCPNRRSRLFAITKVTGGWPVLHLTSSLVMCAVYGICILYGEDTIDQMHRDVD